jgi:glucokinase
MSVRRLVADAGGTNVRFAMADASGGLECLRTYQVGEFSSFADALEAYLSQAARPGTVASAAIAAAGPVDEDHVKLTNNAWSIDRTKLPALPARIPIALVNDLEAVAAALPHLPTADMEIIGGVAPSRPEHRTMLAVNIGTGFGAASVTHRAGRWWTCPTEAGHMSLGAAAEEINVLPKNASIEDVLSGQGLKQLYRKIAGADHPVGDPAAVFAKAGVETAATRAVGICTDILGRTAGDLALATCAWGGVYLCGSVAVGWSAVADGTRFRAEFTRKGAMRKRMEQVPTVVIRRDNVALFGLAVMPLSA